MSLCGRWRITVFPCFGVPEEFGGIPADYVTQMLALMEVSKMRCSGIFNYQRSMYSQYAPFRFCRAAT
ncbi:hypothetical protein ACP0HM_07160 [Escherichia coli]